MVTPSGSQVSLEVRHLRAPGSEGQFGVLRGHLPFMTALHVGALRLDTRDGRQIWATSGGYIEVLSNQVTILAETAEKADQIDLERAKAAKERALGRLAEKSTDIDIKRASLALTRALNRIKVSAEV
ncbi:F0F1 ATP synthase subunit epsilon [bacterium]|nr:F0F1 ATP synthase subunit epsilon [bacterium]